MSQNYGFAPKICTFHLPSRWGYRLLLWGALVWLGLWPLALPRSAADSRLAHVLAQPEVLAWRTEHSRHYDLGDGHYAAVVLPAAPAAGEVAHVGLVQELAQGSIATVEHQPEDEKPAHQQACVGHFVEQGGPRSVRRAYIRFPLPNLPANVAADQITAASFYAAPDGAIAPSNNIPEPFYDEYGLSWMAATVHPMEEVGWVGDTAAEITVAEWPAMGPAVAPLNDGEGGDFLSKNDSLFTATGWDVTTPVQNWYATGNNYGLGIRLAGEESYDNYDVPEPGEGTAATFMCFPSPSEYDYSQYDDGSPILLEFPGGPGMALIIYYTIPELVTDELLSASFPAIQPANAYVNQAHQYNLQPDDELWQMAVVYSDPNEGAPLANTHLELYEYSSPGVGLGLLQTEADEGPFNYLVINPDAAQPDDIVNLRVLPDTTPGAVTESYQLQFLEALPAPPAMPLAPGESISVTISPAFDHALAGQQFAFAEDTTVEVRVSGRSFIEGAPADMRIFAPTTQYDNRDGAGGLPLIYDGSIYEIEFSVTEATAGDWLLAFTNFSYFPVVEVTVCENTNDLVRYPLDGECVELRRPNPNDFNDDTLKTIGEVRVFSPGGFTGDCNAGCETNNTAPSGEPVMPLIGHVNNDDEWVALKGGTATVFAGLNQHLEISLGTRLVMADFSTPNQIVSLPVLRGEFEVDTTGQVTAVSTPSNTDLLVNSPMHPADDNAGQGDKNGWEYSLNLLQGRMIAGGPATRIVQPNPDGVEHTLDFDAVWSISAHGGPSLLGGLTLDQASPLPILVGVLELSPPLGDEYTLEFNGIEPNQGPPQAIPPFEQIRFVGATLAQPANLGGARVSVQGVILPPATAPDSAETLHCGPSCLSLRGPDDSLAVKDYDFRMPDLIIETLAGQVALASQAGLTIYHSDQAGVDATNTTIPFTFEAFEGEVHISQGHCPGPRDPLNPNEEPQPEGPEVTLIVGTAMMNIPGIGETNTDVSGGPALTASFILCSASLREVSVELTLADAAVPLGNSGMFLNEVAGVISVTPGSTQITLEVGVQAMAPTAAASNIFLNAWLLIDTTGFIDLHANAVAKVIGDLGYGGTGHVWVGWSPLDIGFEVRGCMPYTSGSVVAKPSFQQPTNNQETSDLCAGNELVYGMIRAHLWQGAGWQDRYPHLLGSPPDATHFAGRFEADVTLAEGMVADWGLFKLPPQDIKVREVDLAVGEFCTNGPCDSYEWGVMGAYGMLGFKIGMYVNFSSGPHFILGSSDYCLIDEVGAEGGCVASLQRMAATPEVDEQFRIAMAEGAGSALFGLAWNGGAPAMTLIEPAPGDRVIEIPPTGVEYPDIKITMVNTSVGEQALVAIDNPLPGGWIVQLDNLAGVTDYDFVHFANETPDVNFTVQGPNPITDDEATISWTTSMDNPERYRISLWSGMRYQNHDIGGPIVERLPLTAEGSYTWDLSALPGPGIGIPIHIYAQLENAAAEVIADCGDAVYRPDPTERCSTMTHPDLGSAGESILVGIIHYEDVVAPAAPDLINVRAEGETSVMVRWAPNGELDLSGYVVTCQQPGLTRQVRIPPHYPGDSTLPEAVQVNGLNAGEIATCFVQAHDATGNLSLASASDSAIPTGDVPAPPVAPGAVAISIPEQDAVAINWNLAPGVAGYLLYYQPDLSDPGRDPDRETATSNIRHSYRANEGPSPIDVGDVANSTLTGLRPGTTYQVWLRAYDTDGRTGERGPAATITIPEDEPPDGGQNLIFLPFVAR